MNKPKEAMIAEGKAPPFLEETSPLARKKRGKKALHHLLFRDLRRLSEVELVALILRTNEGKRGTALQQAYRLWQTFEGVQRLEDASLAELSGGGDLPESKAASLLAALELGRRGTEKPLLRGQRFSHPRQIYEAFGLKLRGLAQETFWVLLLDQKNRLLKEEHIALGTINHCPLYAADIFRPILREKAVSMVLLHNHPSGDPEPSEEDKRVTKKIQEIAGIIGISVLDHLILGDGCYVSFAERGLL